MSHLFTALRGDLPALSWRWLLVLILAFPRCVSSAEPPSAAEPPNATESPSATEVPTAAAAFGGTIQPILKQYCLGCHSTEKQEGELDLERFSSVDVIEQQPEIWEHVLEQLSIGEMPPDDAPQPPSEVKQRLMDWTRQMLADIALARAGDPGQVILRRLSNSEYTFTIRDLTGIESLDPAREFPVDGAAGEGFTNTGAALVMSPSLLTKYLDAAKEVARHLVLMPDGVRFSLSDSPQDWTDEALTKIRDVYARHTATGEGAQTVQQGIELDVGTGSGRLPLSRYLDALQGAGSTEGLSSKYLSLLGEALRDETPSVILDPLRAKFRVQQLTAADVEEWQKVLWRFTTVGHIGRVGGPKAWQEPVLPLLSEQELRLPLEGDQDQQIFLVAGNAGDGDQGDRVVWANPRLVAKDRPELPISSLPALVEHLDTEKARILASTIDCLAVLGGETRDVDPALLATWREYLGLDTTQLEPLLPTKIERTSDYAFIQGWTAGNDLSILANSSDATVRIPGVMLAHSIAVHPAPDRAAVIAWQSPVATSLKITAQITHAHPECGNGVSWALEVRRGQAVERLASGVAQGAQAVTSGPWESVRVERGQVVALIVGPRDGNHACDLTTVQLVLEEQTPSSSSQNAQPKTWNLSEEVSGNILQGNPQGPWHFLSQPAGQEAVSDLPPAMVEWRKSPSVALAEQVRAELEKHFPLTHPLLARAMRSFSPAAESTTLQAAAPEIIELTIPASLAQGAEFVVTGRLADGHDGSVQLQVVKQRPATEMRMAAPQLPILAREGSAAYQRLVADFDRFRALFPIALCYMRIVPVDEVVTLTLFHREDEPLQRLMLDEDETRELNRLWDELLYVSEAPLKLVDAFEQISQFATQDRPDLVQAFAPLREPIMQRAAEFKAQQGTYDGVQRRAVVNLAAQAWRRPLTKQEIEELQQFPPRLMLVRILTSPDFLYKAEQVPEVQSPVSDWELATRLSYFLWSSMPDEELRQLAAEGRLSQPEVLQGQVRRMLHDEKIRRFAVEFGCQWLHVRDVATLAEKSERHFPTFTEVRDDLQEEVTRFFVDMCQQDAGVLSLLDADHTFVNGALAEHYGLQITGTDWQRVEGLKAQGRGGLLGFGATLAKHSGASRTSAILRGTWVSEVVLGDKLPNPPKGVPVLPEESPVGLTERELIERHSSDPACHSCHRRIDPYGFALEAFDAIGRSRLANTQTVLLDGTQIDGLAGLREYLLDQRRDDFLRQFHRKLLGYALGRSVQLSDQPLIDQLTATDGQKLSSIVEQIVASPQFREIRGRAATVKSARR